MSYFLLNDYDNMEVYIPGEQPHDKKYIKLNANETSLPPSPKVLEAISKAQLSNMGYYSDPHCLELRKAIGSIYDFPAGQVFVGNGADEVLGFCMLSFFRKGMKVCFPDITYDFYRTYAKTYCLDYEQFPLNDDFSVNVEDYINTERDVILANPNNPTGKAISVNDIEKIVAKNPKRMVIIDEAYIDYGTDSCLPLVKKYDNLVVVQTFSKSRNMAGARIGFAISSKEIISDMNKIKFTFNPFNMSSFAIAAGTAAVTDTLYWKKCVQTIIKNREYFVNSMEKLRLNTIPTCTNFAFVNMERLGEGAAAFICNELKKRGILIRHYNEPRIENYLRITIGTREEMDCVINNMKEIIQQVMTECSI